MNDPASTVTPLLETRGVRKRFGSTVALDGVDFDVLRGEVHGLIGENGAGKSTLMHVLSGLVPADAGALSLDGAPYRPRSPAQAARRGVVMIHQELRLAPHLTVEANVTLGIESAAAGFLKSRANASMAREALGRLRRGDLPLGRRVGELSIGDRQIVEIARALARRARLIIMDEPTSSLSQADKAGLYDAIRRLTAEGVGVVYISHFLEEVAEVCDRATVLRDGRSVGTRRVADVAAAELIRLMVGRRIEEVFPRSPRPIGEPLLAVAGLAGREAPRGLNLQLRRGEILGLAGLIGAGRTESLRLIFGLEPLAAGTIRLLTAGGQVKQLRRGAAERLRWRVGLLSEDRQREGLALGLSLAENVVLAAPRTVSRLGWLRTGAVRTAGRRWIERLGIRAEGPLAPAARLSGGNQQKVALARLLHTEADVLLLDEPTRGIDIGSKVEIYRLMDAWAAAGKAILFVSSYFPELLGVCDRVGVMRRGECVELRDAAAWDPAALLAAATGPPS